MSSFKAFPIKIDEDGNPVASSVLDATSGIAWSVAEHTTLMYKNEQNSDRKNSLAFMSGYCAGVGDTLDMLKENVDNHEPVDAFSNNVASKLNAMCKAFKVGAEIAISDELTSE